MASVLAMGAGVAVAAFLVWNYSSTDSVWTGRIAWLTIP